MGDSMNDACPGFSARILSLANGDLLPWQDGALETHLAACGRCRSRLEVDRADRAARETAYGAGTFPAGRGEVFGEELSGRVAQVETQARAPVWRTRGLRAAAALLLLAGGIGIGYLAGPSVKAFWEGGERIKEKGSAPLVPAKARLRSAEKSKTPRNALVPRPEIEFFDNVQTDPERIRFVWPDLKLASADQGGF